MSKATGPWAHVPDDSAGDAFLRFHDTGQVARPSTPEWALCVRVFGQSVDDFRIGLEAMSGRRAFRPSRKASVLPAFRDAVAWFLDPDPIGPYGFRVICGTAGLDPDAVIDTLGVRRYSDYAEFQDWDSDNRTAKKVCQVCSAAYVAVNRNSKYCSGTCRKRATRAGHASHPAVAA